MILYHLRKQENVCRYVIKKINDEQDIIFTSITFFFLFFYGKFSLSISPFCVQKSLMYNYICIFMHIISLLNSVVVQALVILNPIQY